MSTSPKTTISCAICGAPTTYFAAPVGPFCSTRCQLHDLGKWLAEEYCITEPLRPEHLAQYEEFSDAARLDQPET